MPPSTSADGPAADQSNTLRLGFSTNVQLSWIDEFGSLIGGKLQCRLVFYVLDVDSSAPLDIRRCA
jgi:hypothetical protein